jgi:hypothetical protein
MFRPFLLLCGAALLASGCNREPAPEQSGSVTVRLPPARPSEQAAAKPGFSEAVVAGTADKT